jgi:hypothetical protein
MKTPEDEEFERIERENLQRAGIAYVPMTDYERLERKLIDALFEVEYLKRRLETLENQHG